MNCQSYRETFGEHARRGLHVTADAAILSKREWGTA